MLDIKQKMHLMSYDKQIPNIHLSDACLTSCYLNDLFKLLQRRAIPSSANTNTILFWCYEPMVCQLQPSIKSIFAQNKLWLSAYIIKNNMIICCVLSCMWTSLINHNWLTCINILLIYFVSMYKKDYFTLSFEELIHSENSQI